MQQSELSCVSESRTCISIINPQLYRYTIKQQHEQQHEKIPCVLRSWGKRRQTLFEVRPPHSSCDIAIWRDSRNQRCLCAGARVGAPGVRVGVSEWVWIYVIFLNTRNREIYYVYIGVCSIYRLNTFTSKGASLSWALSITKIFSLGMNYQSRLNIAHIILRKECTHLKKYYFIILVTCENKRQRSSFIFLVRLLLHYFTF
jgi:hypothetical protein